VLLGVGAACGADEWIVVSVVVKDRTEGAGEENVLSWPLPELIPQPIVVFVSLPDDGAWDGAASEWATSGSVDIVAAIDLLPMVGGIPSSEERIDRPLRSREFVLIDVPVGTVENDRRSLGIVDPPFRRPDSGYGLLFLEGASFFELDFIW
jgi:hypothetical protein